MTTKTTIGAALAAGFLAVLPGCGSVSDALEEARLNDEANPAPCPNAFALDEAARMIVFDGEPSLSSVAWSAEVTDVRTSCRYVGDAPIQAQVELDFAVGKGPAASGDTLDVTYFVAVTRRDKDLIAKEEFTVPVRIENGMATAELTERIREIVIPRLGEQTSGTNFEIAVGFALSRDQLLYNRSGRSLKFPEL